MALKVFPAVAVHRRENGVEAVAAVKLASILMGDLLLDQAVIQVKGFEQLNRLNPEIIQQDREDFCRPWPPGRVNPASNCVLPFSRTWSTGSTTTPGSP